MKLHQTLLAALVSILCITPVFAEDIAEIRKKAEQGDPTAQYLLASAYNQGDGVPQDFAKGVKWYRKAADQGDVRAQIGLGIVYHLGQGVPKDYAEGVKWYRKAADQGEGFAQLQLGEAYETGNGVPKDYAEGVKWYRKAANQGLGFAKVRLIAQLRLGEAYETGNGVPKDYAEAVKWYRKAADQGDASAQLRLGRAYDLGDGVPEDYIRAYMWYNLASAQGQKAGKEEKLKLTKKMTKEQIAEAQKLSTQWMERKAKEVVEVEVESPALDVESVDDDTKSENLTPTEINNLVKGSVYFIETSGEDGKGSATGFVCYDREILITNFHVLEGSDSISIKDLDGNPVGFEGVLGWDEESDLAAIRISGSKTKGVIKISKTPLQAGDPVVIVGNPSGLVGSVSTGIVAALRDREKSSWIQMTAPISRGSSGSPVLNERGEVVGVATFILSGKARQNTNFASTSKMVHRLIRECRVSKMLGFKSDWKECVTLADLPRPKDEDAEDRRDELPQRGKINGSEDTELEGEMREAWSFVTSDQMEKADPIINGFVGEVPSAFRFLCVAYSGGRYDSAIGQAKACLESYPDSSVVWTALGETYINKKDLKNGMQCLIQAIRSDDSYVRPWAILGSELRRNEAYKSAGIYASKVACSYAPSLRDLYVKNGMWLPELPVEQILLWRDLYASYFWVEIFPADVDAWIIHILSVKKWEGVDRATLRLEVGLKSTDHSPDLMEMKKTL